MISSCLLSLAGFVIELVLKSLHCVLGLARSLGELVVGNAGGMHLAACPS